MDLRRQVRALNARYTDKQEALTKDYEEALADLQALCTHTTNRWEYKLNVSNDISATREGVLIKYHECQNCGLIRKRIDDINDYDAEIEF